MPDRVLDLLERLINWLAEYQAYIPGAMMAATIALFRGLSEFVSASDIQHCRSLRHFLIKWTRVFADSCLCGLVTVGVSAQANAMGLQYVPSVFIGTVIGVMGMAVLRSLLLRVVRRKAEVL